jgi:hypothetical protein
MSKTFSDIVTVCGFKMLPMAPRKDAPVAFRIPTDLKQELLRISEKEARSLSQICEILLRTGAEQYRNEGARFLEKHLARKKSAF